MNGMSAPSVSISVANAKLPQSYEQAKQALAECLRIDEAKEIRDRAVALEVYARQAKDGTLVAHATEIKARATRRLGELMEVQRKDGVLKRGGSRVSKKPLPKTLAQQGIDKNLADRARKAAANARANPTSESTPSAMLSIILGAGRVAQSASNAKGGHPW